MQIIHERALSEKRLEAKRFVQLFEDAKRRQILERKCKKTISDSECTFNPNIDLTQEFNATEIIKRKPLYQNIAIDNSKGKKLISETDNHTGKLLYKPQTGRPPKNRFKSRAESIGEYLYKLKKSNANKVKKKTTTKNVIQIKSKRIIERLRKEGFELVFNKLDLDGDGIINADSVNLNKLPKNIAIMFIPLIQEMEEMKCTLNLNEFIDAAINLFKELTVVQKEEFIEYYKSLTVNKKIHKNPLYDKYSFKVKIDIIVAFYM